MDEPRYLLFVEIEVPLEEWEHLLASQMSAWDQIYIEIWLSLNLYKKIKFNSNK